MDERFTSAPVASAQPPGAVLRLSWKRATSLAALVVYGPFVIMALCTLLFVDCDHCKKAACRLLPCGPGLLPLELLRRLFSFQSLGELYWLTTAFFVALGEVFLLAALLRKGGWFLRAGLAGALIIFSFIAYCTLSMIRS